MKNNNIKELLIEYNNKKKKQKKRRYTFLFSIMILMLIFGLIIIGSKYEKLIGYSIVLLLIAILFILLFQNLIKQILLRRWIETECLILNKSVFIDESYGQFGTIVSYMPIIYYYYSFDNRVFVSDNLDYGLKSCMKEKNAQKRILGFQEDGIAKCFVNPRKPEESVLYVTFRWSRILLYLSGVIFFLFVLIYDILFRSM